MAFLNGAGSMKAYSSRHSQPLRPHIAHSNYVYVDLNGDLDSLRENLKAYYRSHILDKMFEYELVK